MNHDVTTNGDRVNHESKARAVPSREIGWLLFAFATSVYFVAQQEAPLPFGASRMGVIIATSIGTLVALGKVLSKHNDERWFPLTWVIAGVAAVSLLCLLWLAVGW